MFNSVVKDFTGSKEKHIPLMENEDPKESIQELSAIFSYANFPPDANNTVDENQLESNLGITMPHVSHVNMLPEAVQLVSPYSL
jgi:hypothetical protein